MKSEENQLSDAVSSDDISSSRKMRSQSQETPLLPRIVSGSFGSIVTTLLFNPLEVVKFRQQVDGVSGVLPAPSAARSSGSSRQPIASNRQQVEPCPGTCRAMTWSNGFKEFIFPKKSTPRLVSKEIPAALCVSSLRMSSCMPCPNLPLATSKRRGTLYALQSIFRNEGWAGLYAGLRPTLLMSVPNTVLYFTAYDEISHRLRKIRPEGQQSANNWLLFSDTFIPMIAGSTARLAASLATSPLELIRTRQAVLMKNKTDIKSSGIAEEFRFLLQIRGVSSLFVGLGPTLWRDVPFSALYWLCLENIRHLLRDWQALGQWGACHYKNQGEPIPRSVDLFHSFISGAVAGTIAAAFTTPFDVVKTRRQITIQTETCASASLGHLEHNKSRLNTRPTVTPFSHWGTKSINRYLRTNPGTFVYISEIFHNEGLAGLWKGNQARVIRVAPACAVMISCYELGKSLFNDTIVSQTNSS